MSVHADGLMKKAHTQIKNSVRQKTVKINIVLESNYS